MSTSFVVNLNDLNKILEQIKIAERNAAGENLVDIIGADSALLPLGLRTVDGSYNHLLPGQSKVGAADEIFPRLLTPVYINEADGDTQMLAPPGTPGVPPGGLFVTNTDYDPTKPGTHSVADADPRIISNLIVDQTLNNRSALVAALVVAGVENANTAADEILGARSGLLANQAAERAYEAALVSAGTVSTQTATAATELNNLLTGIQDNSLDPADEQDAADALAAATAAVAAQTSLIASLQTIAAPELVAANALLTSLNGLVLQAQAIVTSLEDHDLSATDVLAIPTALVAASAASVGAAANLAALVTSEGNANTAVTQASTTLDGLISGYDIEISSDGSVLIENRSPDIGLSPPNSAWMTFFGQFFDHGLDLVTKGNNGTIYIPLQADDPLIAGADHVFGTADDLPAHLRFMTLTRTTPFDANGNPVAGGTEAENTTTPFVDQNQTYTSNASHQVFLREYRRSSTPIDIDHDGDLDNIVHTVNTGRLLNGVNGGIANWGEVKSQALTMLGLKLNDLDVLDVPKLAVDAYGNFEAGPNGFAKVYVTVKVVDGAGNIVSTLPGEFLMEGTAAGLDLHNLPQPGGLAALPPGQAYAVSVVGTGHAFLNDIAHDAAPVAIGGVLQPDANEVVNSAGTILPNDGQGHNLQYDDEMLNSHFVTGDGRGNENIGLTAVHTIFHSEHNRLVEANKATILASGDLAVINEWLTTDITQLPQSQADIDALDWDGSRLFQAARFVTEMQYQHLVFEEFARRVQPLVDPFVFTNSADLNPAIVAEFAHTVYRFGHSMLTDTVDRLDNNLNVVGDADLTEAGAQQVGLIEAFLNPQLFTASGIDDETATGALIRGLSRQVSNEIDEFVVEALRNNLLGLPLDLPALNIARGRDTGIPSLNESRAQIYEMTGAVDVKPYTSWIDFAQHIKHPLSIINFIAAYGTHPLITAETTLEGKRAAALAIVLGTDEEVPANPNMQPPVLAHTIHAPADRFDFLNATGAYARDGAGPNDDSLGGMNNVDLWIGGLAEELNEFGGQLGSTFNFIFEYQMEHLQNGDRFYYLSRTQGMNLLNLLEPNTFTDLVMRNTDLGDLHATHLPALLMSTPDMTLELDNLAGQANYSGDTALDGTNPSNRSLLDPTHDDPFLQAIDPKVVRVQGQQRFEQDGITPVLDADGKPIFDGGILKFSGGEHVVLGGTEGNDRLYGDKGIDTLWGDGGNDYLNAGMESDNVFGGDGDDIIEDPFGDNFLRGEAGDDVIVSDTGLSLLFGGEGQDFIAGVTDVKEVFAGPGNDFILGGSDSDVLMGNEGDDWIEGGEGFDGISGGNSELFFNSVVDGHDILNGQGNDTDYDGENGDDIMVDGPGIQRNNGMDGFDWTIFKGDNSPVDADLGIRPFATRPALILRDRFDSVEGLSGWKNDDILTGAAKLLIGEGFTDALTQAGVDRIDGLRSFLGAGASTGNPNDVVFESDTNAGGEIILGGAGSDTIRGNLGDDILDGDAWLNVRISVREGKNALGPVGGEIASFDSLTSQIAWTSALPPSWQATDFRGVGTGLTKQLSELMSTGLVNPGQLQAVREILTSTNAHLTDGNKVGNNVDRDVAVFSDVRANYTIETVTPGGPIGDGDGDGFITVAHTPVGGGGGGGGGVRDSDGIDKIRNFEILSFADGNIFLDPTIQNTAATGLLNVTINPDIGAPGANVGDTFRVTLGTVADGDGLPPIASFTFAWEFEATLGAGDWQPVADPVTGDPIVGPTFTPTAAFELDGLRLRAAARFTDLEGVPESVFSAPTAALAAQAVAVATAGDDVLVGTNGSDFINALAGDDTITALGGNDVVIGGPGSDIADGGLGTDTAVFFGPIANFTFALTPEGQLQVVDAAAGDEDTVVNFETLLFIDSPTPLTDAQVASIVAGGTIAGVTVVSQSVADLFDGVFINDANVANTLTGTEFGDVIFGNGGDDIIDGLGGDDLLVGGNGDDNIDSGGGNDVVSGGNSTAVGNTIRLRTGDETLLVGLAETGSDTVRNDGGTERLSIGAVAVIDAPNETGTVAAQPGAIDTLDASDDGAGNLVVSVNNKTVTVTDHFNDPNSVLELVNFNGSSFDGINLGASDYNLVAAAAGVTTLNGGTGNDALFGTAAGDTLNGNAGNDLLLGGGGGDSLNGGDGNDILDGGAGNDAMTGGTGDDIYVIDSAGDTVTEAVGASGGVDTITGARNLNLTNAAFANVENVTLTGTGAFTATGNTGDNVLTGNAGNNTLNGGLGTDTAVFEGTALTASFAITGGNVTVTTATGGTDTLQGIEKVRLGTTTYSLVAGAAGIQLLNGTAGDDLILGFGGVDTLNGLGGNDVLDGGNGNDIMSGGTGNDTYIVDGAGDVINEGAAAVDGIDTVAGSLTLSLAGYTNVENVTLLGVGNFNATGNGGDNILTGNAGTNILTGDAGNDTYVVGAGDSVVEAAGAAGGIDTASGERNINLNNAAFANVENITLLGTGNFNGTGNNGDNIIVGNSGNNDIAGNQGNDRILAGAGNDVITWGITNGGVSDGRDFVDGGTESGAGDTFIVNGNNESEIYGVYSNTDDWDNNPANGIVSSAAHAGLTGLAAQTEIVITRNTSGAVSNANIIAELTDIEEIVINTGAGASNVVLPVGDFNGTALNFNTITVNDGGGSTTVDLTSLKSRHHVAFHTSGSNDTMIGGRPQDQVIADGTGGGNGGGGNGGGGNGGGGNSGGGGGGGDVVGNGAFQLTPSDVAALKNLVNGREGGEDNDAAGIRDLEGTGNNRAHPEYGSADQPFIRITDAHYGAYNPATGNNDINPLFAGLDPRAISNALGAQEAGTPTSAQNVNALFTAFGQYFDHGLDFLGKGGNGTISIGGAGTGHAPGTDNPADLTRGTVDSIVDGVPQHLNKASPFVDQNQAYGSNELVGQFLREADGVGGFSGRLLAGGPDPSNPGFNLLPNLRELIQHHWQNNTVFTDDSLPGGSVHFRDYFAGLVDANGVINQSMLPAMTSNFMDSGFALLLDTNPFINLLDHYVAGDGRANENIALTSIHTIWARNHNFHVEGLIEAGFTGTSEELFQAAKLINEVEYQRVVFTEFADHLLGGIKGDGDHGFDGYNPNVDARVSHEFATAAYRFGHSLINQTMTVLDAQGNPTSVPLFDAFLNPTNDPSAFPTDPSAFYTPKPGYEQLGINGILGGAMGQAAEEVDVNIVDAVRNDLVRISADVFAFDVAREWDVGIGSMNQIRADLMASTDPYVREAVGFAGDLTPYSSWEDFQTRNNLSNAVINQFKQAYPDLVLAAADIAAFQAINPGIQLTGPNHDTVRGIDRVDLFVGGLAETHINGGVVGQTFWVILHEQLDRLQEGDRLYYLDRAENLDFYDIVEEQGFASIIARNTGLTGLPEDIFGTRQPDNQDDGNDGDNDLPGNGDDGDDDQPDGGDDDGDDDQPGDGDGDGDDDGDSGTVTPPPVVAGLVLAGTAQTDVLTGGAGEDNIVALASDDVVVGNAGDDAISGGEGSDLINGGAGRDVIFAGSGDDQVFGGDHADMIYGDAGADRLFGGDGNDMITAGTGDDSVFGGAGNDRFVAEVGDGNDIYFGDDADGGAGIDTLDISAATVDTLVNLGSGTYPKGTAYSSQTGNDTIWGIENVNTGSGNDTIIASNVANIINGGAGNDTYKFMTAAAADGDTILGFAPGDRVDLSAIDANTGTATNDAFTLITGAEFTAAGQLAVSFESRADGDFTVIQGNIDGNLDADFRFEVEGHHQISNANVIV